MHPKQARAAQAQETVAALTSGSYVTASGQHVDISAPLAAAVAGTCEYVPDWQPPAPRPRGAATELVVVGVDTLAAARDLPNPVVLNFASARHPGGGFLNGAQAQEECLARDTGLYACINGRRMYQHNRGKDCLYTHAMIYSPAVPVLRDETGQLLAAPWTTAIITAPAPNAGVVLQREPHRVADVEAALTERARRVLAVAHAHDHQHLVLGAWGCGVFRNDPATVARTFHQLLVGPYDGVFTQVVFAVLDSSSKGRTLQAFQHQFAGE